MRSAFLLISLAVGYGVLVLAKREAKPLNKIGLVVGWFIMVVSVAGLICTAAAGLCRMCPSKKGGAAMGWSCPVGGEMKGAACLMPPLDASKSQQPAERK